MQRIEANKQITEPDSHGYQVRIVRSKKQHSRYFAHAQWGGKRKSLSAARNWRDQMLTSLGRIGKYIIDRPALANNTTTGVRGVTKGLQFKEETGLVSLSYYVHWRKNGKPMNKTFYVGDVEKITTADELHAFRTAVQFRREYELSLADNACFVRERFLGWKRKTCY